jgi:hypothetical protein
VSPSLPLGGVGTRWQGTPQRITSQAEVISSLDKYHNELLNTLYKAIYLSSKVKMVLLMSPSPPPGGFSTLGVAGSVAKNFPTNKR